MHKPNITLLFQLQSLFEDAKIEMLYQFLAELTYQYYHHKTFKTFLKPKPVFYIVRKDKTIALAYPLNINNYLC